MNVGNASAEDVPAEMVRRVNVRFKCVGRRHALPRKRASSAGHDKALDRFYALVTEALLRHVDFGVVKCVLVASPGFLKDDWWRHAMDEAARAQEKALLKNRAKFMLCHASSGHKRALSEVLAQPAVAAQVADTKAGDEVRALERFFELLATP